jgi:hypothetical protein
MDYIAASRRATVDLGMPAFSQAAPHTVTASTNPPDT